MSQGWADTAPGKLQEQEEEQNTPGTGSPKEEMIPRDTPCQRDSLCQHLGSSRHLLGLSTQTLPGTKVTNTEKSFKISVPPPSYPCAGGLDTGGNGPKEASGIREETER